MTIRIALIVACGAIAAATASGPTPVAAQANPVAQDQSQVPQTQGPLVPMTPETIRELRQLFYDRNFAIRGLEPDPGADLDGAIKALQKRLHQPVTGVLTVPQFDALRNTPQPGLWGAIGYTGIGGHVGVTDRPTRARAEEDAKAECQRKTFRKCDALAVAGNQCVALVHSFYNDGVHRVAETFPAFGDTPTSVAELALADCRARSHLRDNCELRQTLCADGRN